MIIRLFPGTAWGHLDLVIEEQAAYYGAQNAHIIEFLKRKLEGK